MSLPHVDWVLDDFKPEPLTVDEVVGEPCKGRLFRCRVSRYRRPRTGVYTHTVEFRPLKRLSCPGCDSCEALHEFIRESDGMFDYPPNPVDGALYRLKVTAMGYEYDINAYSVEVVGFVLIEEESGT